MNQSADGPADGTGGDGYRALSAVLSGLERRVGVAPQAVEAKAESEARLVVEAVALDAAPVAWTLLEARWDQGKTETPGVRQWAFEYTVRLEVGPARTEEVLTQVRAYWLTRGLHIRNWDPTFGVSASPDKGSWLLGVGVLDEASMYARVASGLVMTSSNPLRSGRES